jgi:competence protein ComFC
MNFKKIRDFQMINILYNLWNMNKSDFGKFLLDLFFPKCCLGCRKEGSYLCPDCLSTMEIMENCFCLCSKPSIMPGPGKCRRCRDSSFLDGLHFSVSYKNNLAKNLIRQFKYEPYAKELSDSLVSLIITHFALMQQIPAGVDFALVAVPISKNKLKRRGYNQSLEIAKKLAENWKIPPIEDCLVKEKETKSQMELSREERMENIKGVFSIKDATAIKNKKVFLIDDVYTTGATMSECARVLKQAGASQVWGIAVAREE